MANQTTNNAALFGINKSNKNFTRESAWGKNQFNSTFPTALLIYMHTKNLKPVYLKTDSNNNVVHDYIQVKDIFGIEPLSDDVSYQFESTFPQYSSFYQSQDKQEKIDLVVRNTQTGLSLSGLEIKLTTLPDASTMNKPEDKYGCEIVVRNPTINFIACSICAAYPTEEDKNRLSGKLRISGFYPDRLQDIEYAYNNFDKVRDAILRVLSDINSKQSPLIVQPVWKAVNGRLSDNCLDVFVWSNLAVVRLCLSRFMNTHHLDTVKKDDMKRPMRTIICIYQMLLDYVQSGSFRYKEILGKYVYGGKNDKAFSINGTTTHPIMQCQELLQPRICKSEIKNIILNNGQKYLKPERRFDAFVVNEINSLFE